MEMYLAHDAFKIEYDPVRVTLEEMFARIRGLGYRPHEMTPVRDAASEPPPRGSNYLIDISTLRELNAGLP